MNLEDYQESALRSASHIDIFNVETDTIFILRGVLGVCGEGGEMLEHLKKVMYQGHSLDKRKLIDELGDTLWYCAYLAHALDMTLTDIAHINLAKLWQRYPEGFDSRRSLARHEWKQQLEGEWNEDQE